MGEKENMNKKDKLKEMDSKAWGQRGTLAWTYLYLFLKH